jgi:tetratricopeptide (TPR) repeat protein
VDKTNTAPPNPALDATLDSSSQPSASAALPDYPDLVTVDPEHYVAGKEIARGGMGRIRRARDRRLRRDVAVKEILVKTGEAARRFEREARITARLQHPSIVNIHEAGVWPSGEPFYAMKLVTGRPLDEVIADAKTFEQRLALVPNVLAVADAMAYAHGERVIHRDLKPKNVLVGAFGETVVIDWGLAKDLADAGSEPDGGGTLGSADHAKTAFGAVMGTPAYMPPEQASGQPVDERADVYAIGVLLDHVLSGKPPFTGTSSDEILEAVKRGSPTPLSDRQPGVPPDLLAIVERAMQRLPSRRYPTARELAEDLRRFQTGQLVGTHRYSPGELFRRWVRRHRAAVTVAGVALVVMIALGAFAVRRIVQARHDAEDERALAEEALSSISWGVNARLPYTPFEELDDNTGRYYRRRGESPGDPGFARTLAVSRATFRDAFATQGGPEQALAAYRRAAALYARISARYPSKLGDLGFAPMHATACDALCVLGDAADAVYECREALVADEAHAAKNPTPRRIEQLPFAHERVAAALLTNGDAAGALVELRAALAVRDKLQASLGPNRPAHDEPNYWVWMGAQVGGGRYRDMIGDVLFSQRDHAGALESYRAAIADYEVYGHEHPAAPDLPISFAREHAKVGDVLLAQGDATGALDELRKALAFLETAAAKSPLDLQLRLDRSAIRERIGDALFATRDAAGALAEYQAVLELDEKLAKHDPPDAEAQAAPAFSNEKIGDALLALQHDQAGALARYRTALEIRKALVASDPANAYQQRHLAALQKKIEALGG